MKSNHNQILRSSLMIACAATAVSGAFAQEGGASTGQAAEKTVAERRVIDEIFVRGRRLGDLRGDTASAVTLSDIPLEDLPLNVSVIPRGLIDLVNPRDTRRVIEQNASVVTRTGHVQSFQGIFIRGFSNDGEINGRLKNGVPFYGVDSPIADNSVLERVEVLKGSAGLLFGAASPGGVLNYVYKTPQEEPAYGVDVTVGDFSTLRADLDATGAVISDTLNYRFTLGYEDSDGWQDYDYYEKLAPTLQLQARLGARTTVSLLAELINVDSNPSNQDTVFTGGRTGTPIELPIETYLGHANDYSEERTEQFQFVANHDFDNGFGLVAQFGSNTTEREQGNTGYMGFFGAPSPSGDVTRVQFDQKRTSDGKYGAVHLTWAGETGDFTHKALIGVNASENQMFNINGFSSRAAPFAGPFVEGGVLPPTTQINIYNPVTTDYPHLTNFADSPPFSHLQWTYEDRGLNLQDLIGYDA
ncbi:MAG: TonB-dependent receptor plug domain-containing protein, partial [Pseudomonadota bacterium]